MFYHVNYLAFLLPGLFRTTKRHRNFIQRLLHSEYPKGQSCQRSEFFLLLTSQVNQWKLPNVFKNGYYCLPLVPYIFIVVQKYIKICHRAVLLLLSAESVLAINSTIMIYRKTTLLGGSEESNKTLCMHSAWTSCFGKSWRLPGHQSDEFCRLKLRYIPVTCFNGILFYIL